MGDHKSHIRHVDTSHVGGPYIHVVGPYNTCSISGMGDHKISIPCKVWEDPRSYNTCGGTYDTFPYKIRGPSDTWSI